MLIKVIGDADVFTECVLKNTTVLWLVDPKAPLNHGDQRENLARALGVGVGTDIVLKEYEDPVEKTTKEEPLSWDGTPGTLGLQSWCSVYATAEGAVHPKKASASVGLERTESTGSILKRERSTSATSLAQNKSVRISAGHADDADYPALAGRLLDVEYANRSRASSVGAPLSPSVLKQPDADAGENPPEAYDATPPDSWDGGDYHAETTAHSQYKGVPTSTYMNPGNLNPVEMAMVEATGLPLIVPPMYLAKQFDAQNYFFFALVDWHPPASARRGVESKCVLIVHAGGGLMLCDVDGTVLLHEMVKHITDVKERVASLHHADDPGVVLTVKVDVPVGAAQERGFGTRPAAPFAGDRLEYMLRKEADGGQEVEEAPPEVAYDSTLPDSPRHEYILRKEAEHHGRQAVPTSPATTAGFSRASSVQMPRSPKRKKQTKEERHNYINDTEAAREQPPSAFAASVSESPEPAAGSNRRSSSGSKLKKLFGKLKRKGSRQAESAPGSVYSPPKDAASLGPGHPGPGGLGAGASSPLFGSILPGVMTTPSLSTGPPGKRSIKVTMRHSKVGVLRLVLDKLRQHTGGVPLYWKTVGVEAEHAAGVSIHHHPPPTKAFTRTDEAPTGKPFFVSYDSGQTPPASVGVHEEQRRPRDEGQHIYVKYPVLNTKTAEPTAPISSWSNPPASGSGIARAGSGERGRAPPALSERSPGRRAWAGTLRLETRDEPAEPESPGDAASPLSSRSGSPFPLRYSPSASESESRSPSPVRPTKSCPLQPVGSVRQSPKRAHTARPTLISPINPHARRAGPLIEVDPSRRVASPLMNVQPLQSCDTALGQRVVSVAVESPRSRHRPPPRSTDRSTVGFDLSDAPSPSPQYPQYAAAQAYEASAGDLTREAPPPCGPPVLPAVEAEEPPVASPPADESSSLAFRAEMVHRLAESEQRRQEAESALKAAEADMLSMQAKSLATLSEASEAVPDTSPQPLAQEQRPSDGSFPVAATASASRLSQGQVPSGSCLAAADISAIPTQSIISASPPRSVSASGLQVPTDASLVSHKQAPGPSDDAEPLTSAGGGYDMMPVDRYGIYGSPTRSTSTSPPWQPVAADSVERVYATPSVAATTPPRRQGPHGNGLYNHHHRSFSPAPAPAEAAPDRSWFAENVVAAPPADSPEGARRGESMATSAGAQGEKVAALQDELQGRLCVLVDALQARDETIRRQDALLQDYEQRREEEQQKALQAHAAAAETLKRDTAEAVTPPPASPRSAHRRRESSLADMHRALREHMGGGAVRDEDNGDGETPPPQPPSPEADDEDAALDRALRARYLRDAQDDHRAEVRAMLAEHQEETDGLRAELKAALDANVEYEKKIEAFTESCAAMRGLRQRNDRLELDLRQRDNALDDCMAALRSKDGVIASLQSEVEKLHSVVGERAERSPYGASPYIRGRRDRGEGYGDWVFNL